MKYCVTHTTTYRYPTSAEACHNALRLTPRTTDTQSCHEVSLRIEPSPARVCHHVDFFGNHVHHFVVLEPHQQLSITAEATVTVDRAEPVPANSLAWNDVRRHLHRDHDSAIIEALAYVSDSTYVRSTEGLRDYAAASFSSGPPVFEAAADLTQRIHRDFIYDPTATKVDTSTEFVLKKRRGVCQDFAHLQIGCLRALGLAARYVSGYLRTDPGPGQDRLRGADASHAWVSLFCPTFGWIGFDPTNGCVVSDSHITLAWGRDYHDVSPVKGIVLGPAESAMDVAVNVEEA
jgi:transglutaminase-like putative cysteine protease